MSQRNRRSQPFELVIFDCDGVLIDSEVIMARAHARAFSAAGWATDEQTVIDRFAGVADPTMYRIVETELGCALPHDHAANVSSLIQQAYHDELQAVPGIHEIIDDLPVTCCVASNSSRGKVEAGLRATGLYAKLTPHIFTASMVATGKPAPDLFILAADRLGVLPQNCLVVEDTITGITAARAANMTALGFCGGSHCRSGDGQLLLEHGADLVIDDMSDFKTAMKQLRP